MTQAKAKRDLIGSMIIFGTIGVFVRYINLPSGLIAAVRGLVGMAVLVFVAAVKGERVSLAAIKNCAVRLILSGVCMGFNWILLFESYRYTSVSTATLCYYLAPMFVIAASPLLLHERLTLKKVLCVLAALFGMVLISGVTESGISDLSELKGVGLGVGAAALYASVILINKKISGVSAYERTSAQLGIAAAAVGIYVLVTGEAANVIFEPVSALMLLVVSVLHTGMAYSMYFGSMRELKAQTIAVFSYIDPLCAILCSAAVLGEKMTPAGAVGAAFILGAALVSEEK